MYTKIYARSEQLCLRSFEYSDAEILSSYRSEPEILKFQDFNPTNIATALKYIEENKKNEFGEPDEWVQVAIAIENSNCLIGDIGVKITIGDNRYAIVGITISTKEQRKGYATQAMNLMLSILFEKYDCEKVVAMIISENIPSIRFFQSLGFKMEPSYNEQFLFKGKWSNEYCFSLLRNEWV